MSLTRAVIIPKDLRRIITCLKKGTPKDIALGEELEKTWTSDRDTRYYQRLAEDQLGRDGEIEFDQPAAVSVGDDPGAYVNAWVWVYDRRPRKDE